MSKCIDHGRPILHTLSDCYCSHVEVWAWCEIDAAKCYRGTNLDLPALIARYGDIEVREIKRRLTCTFCERRSGSIRLVSDGIPFKTRRELPPAPAHFVWWAAGKWQRSDG